jgi:putative oxidoreductase
VLASLHRLDRYQTEGLLLLRVGLGVMFLVYGYPKISGGIEGWTKLGGVMNLMGIGFFPAFWGFMSAATEFFGGLLLLLGLLFRPVCLLLIINLAVAVVMHLNTGGGFMAASHAIDLIIVFTSLFFIGPGKHSIDDKIWGVRTNNILNGSFRR